MVIMLTVTLPDGKTLEMVEGATTADVAARIGPKLAKAAVAGYMISDSHPQGRILDLNRSLPGDCRLRILTGRDDDADSLYVLRHSTAHVMAEAICKLFPETKLVYGPPVENGYYYDIDLDRQITPEDFPGIEAEMEAIVKEDRRFTRYDMNREQGMAKVKSEGNPFKVDNAERAEGDTLSFYVTGEPNRNFEDLCAGPHLPNTGRIAAFRLMQVSGAYHHGDASAKQLQRVYGTAFYDKKSLQQYIHQLEEAKKRDHRVLGKDLGLFTISQTVGSGLILWMPKGAIVRGLLEEFMKGELLKLGYEPVYTPHIGQLDLYRTSGHYPYYEDAQFPALFETDRGKALLGLRQFIQQAVAGDEHRRERLMSVVQHYRQAIENAWGAIAGLDSAADSDQLLQVLERELSHEVGYLLKPMNCPHHIQIYAAQPRSYRDLPVRLAEFGTVYRWEQSGELNGMIRVRGFTQDDAHLFCTAEQLEDELRKTIVLTQHVLSTLGLTDYRIRVGLRDPSSDKYVGSDAAWLQAENVIRKIAGSMDLNCSEELGEAAFYGPKIDFVVRDCIGRSWQLGTVQVDYNLPERFELTYVGADNRLHRPIMIHRAPFGSLERFCGILIEHFAGAFPLWLAPVQAIVLTVSEKSAEYGREVYHNLRSAGLRAGIDDSSEKIGPKKHKARKDKIPYILVVGEQEQANGTVNVNDRDGTMLGNFSVNQFLTGCLEEIRSKGHQPEAVRS